MNNQMIERAARAIESSSGNPDTFTGTVSRTALRDAEVALASAYNPDERLREALEEVREFVDGHRHCLKGKRPTKIWAESVLGCIEQVLDRSDVKSTLPQVSIPSPTRQG